MRTQGKVPELRFPEFSGEWEGKSLGDMVEFHKGSGLSKSDLSDKGIPCILYGELYTIYNEVINQVVSKTNSNKKLFMSQLNDVIIPSSGETAEDISCASAVLLNNIALGGDLNVLRPKENINGSYLSYILNSVRKNDIAKIAQGASVVHLYSKDLKKLDIIIPTLKEQTKIANFFILMNEKIEKQQEKITNLEDYKKSMMQKIFSQEIRFKDENGEDYPKWEEKKFGGIVKGISSGKTTLKYEKGSFNVYGSTGIIGYTEQPDYQGIYVLIARVGANAGTINIIDEECGVSDNTLMISYKDSLHPLFSFYQLKNFNLNKLIFGSGQPLITSGQLKKLFLLIPNIQEQIKIVVFLSSIDAKIKKEKEKLEILKEFKKGLMQKMLV